MSDRPLRLVLVDDSVLLRSALASLINTHPDMEVVEQASDGLEGLEKIRQARPDLVLMDIRMPRCDGITCTKLIKQELPTVRVIMLTVSEEEEDLFEAIKNGAEGYLGKDLESAELFQALEKAAAGEVVMSPVIAAKIWKQFREWARAEAQVPSRLPDLTPRELEVLRLVREGAANQEIARALHITVGTVKNHLHNILEKLHLRNRAEAAVYMERLHQHPEPQGM